MANSLLPGPGGRCVYSNSSERSILVLGSASLRGKGRELAKTAWSPAIVGDWDISPDGSQVAIPNHDPRNAKIRVTPLDVASRNAGDGP